MKKQCQILINRIESRYQLINENVKFWSLEMK